MSSDGGDGEKAPAKDARGRRKLLLAGAGAALLLLGAGGGYMMLGGGAAAAEGHGATDGDAHGAAANGSGADADLPLDVPPMLVNLRTPDGAPHFLKVHVMLVPGAKSDLEDLRKKLPVLLDTYQPFLRELRPEDLSGSAAVYRIKEEMLLRSAAALGRDQVKDVLVQDLVQQ